MRPGTAIWLEVCSATRATLNVQPRLMSKPPASRAAFLLFVVLVACVHLPDNSRRVPSRAFLDTSETALARFEAATREAAGQPGSANGFFMLADGLDAFVARTTLARVAERSLDVQYYLYHDDFIGLLLTHALLEAADRGVRVRILVDDMDFGGRDRGLALVDAHPRIEIRMFNPFDRKSPRTVQYVTRMGSVTRRMHNKSFTADNRVTIDADELRLAQQEVARRVLAARGSRYLEALDDSSLARDMRDRGPEPARLRSLVGVCCIEQNHNNDQPHQPAALLREFLLCQTDSLSDLPGAIEVVRKNLLENRGNLLWLVS
jgi:PLD-like domain